MEPIKFKNRMIKSQRNFFFGFSNLDLVMSKIDQIQKNTARTMKVIIKSFSIRIVFVDKDG